MCLLQMGFAILDTFGSENSPFHLFFKLATWNSPRLNSTNQGPVTMVGEYLIELLANFPLPRGDCGDLHWPRDLDTESRKVDVRDGTLHGSIQRFQGEAGDVLRIWNIQRFFMIFPCFSG